MSSVHLPPIEGIGIAVTAAHADDAITLAFTGTADLTAEQPLAAILARLHIEAQRLRVEEVVCDFRELEFMSAPCFKSFVAWVGRVEEMTKPYRLRFRANPQTLWQRRSLHALRCLAPELIAVES